MMINNKKNPYRDFKYRLMMEGRAVGGFTEVGGLTIDNDPVEFQEHTERMRPAERRYEPITLERGLTHDPDFEQWANITSQYGPARKERDLRKNLRMTLYNEAGQLLIAFKLFRCWISGFQAMPELDAGSNAVAIKSLKLENEGWERIDDTP